jgi:hypothetical protein
MTNKLFDFEDDHLEDDDLPEEENTQSFKRDKIFNNDYNTGNLDFEEFSLPKVDTFYSEKNLDDCYNSHDYEREKKLQEMVDKFFRESDLFEALEHKKKIPKQNIPLVFVAIKKRFESDEFTGSEIFSAIAEYFGMNYEILYENIPSIYREQLVRELDDRYGILKKRGVKRLF